jgi:hypothetical protein
MGDTEGEKTHGLPCGGEVNAKTNDSLWFTAGVQRSRSEAQSWLRDSSATGEDTTKLLVSERYQFYHHVKAITAVKDISSAK